MYHVSAQGVDEGMINVHVVVVVVVYILGKTCSWFNLACRQQNSNKYTRE